MLQSAYLPYLHNNRHYFTRSFPSWEPRYPLPFGTFESMIFSFSQVGICDRSLKGTILYTISRWWFQKCFMFTLFSGKICNLSIFFIIFQMGWFNHQPVVTWNSKMQVFLFNWVSFEVLAANLQGCTTCVPYSWWFRNPANHLGFYGTM